MGDNVVERTFPRHFENLDQKWRPCALCGQQMYPESQLVFKDGLYFCNAHYNFRYHNKAIDKYIPKVSDLEED